LDFLNTYDTESANKDFRRHHACLNHLSDEVGGHADDGNHGCCLRISGENEGSTKGALIAQHDVQETEVDGVCVQEILDKIGLCEAHSIGIAAAGSCISKFGRLEDCRRARQELYFGIDAGNERFRCS